jgi:hypothetical protein
MPQGESVRLASDPCTIALDGERELEIRDHGVRLEVRLDPRGPRVVDVDAALAAGARTGVFVRQVGPDLSRAGA